MLPSKSVFPSEPLDSRDRLILEAVCKYGREGQSFNKLVEEVKHFASRSTFALRIERLQRLGYIEKLPDKKRKQVKRIRGSLQTRMLMWIVAKARDDIAKIERLLSEKESELSKHPQEISREQVEAFRNFIREEFEKINRIFGSIAFAAVTYGETAAGDIFLPSVVESFRSVMLKLASIIKKNPELSEAAFRMEEKPPEEKIKEAKMFFDKFGEEVLERLPRHLQSRKAIIGEIMKSPEKLGLLLSALWRQKKSSNEN